MSQTNTFDAFIGMAVALGVVGVVLFVLSLLFFLLIREVMCWYWKVNETNELLRQLVAQTKPRPMPQTSIPVVSGISDARSSYEEKLYEQK